MTLNQLRFLEAVAADTLPQYSTMGVLRRTANRLTKDGLLDRSQEGSWTRYSLTAEGRAKLAGARVGGTS